MNYGATGSATAAAYATMANAIKASGTIVRVDRTDFLTVLNKIDKPIVIYSQGGFLSAKHQYLTPYKGLVFMVKCNEPIPLPSSTEIIRAKTIWSPS